MSGSLGAHGGQTMSKSILSAASLVLVSVGTAGAWSEQNCKTMCRLTAAPDRVETCYSNIPCSKFAAGKHESDAYVRQKAAGWKAKQRGLVPGVTGINVPAGVDPVRYRCQTIYASARFKALEDACVARVRGRQ